LRANADRGSRGSGTRSQMSVQILPLAPPVNDSAGGKVYLHLNLSQIAAVMDTLRYEKPLYVY
jgi:hypothetical protein